jgi:hypothetical protein
VLTIFWIMLISSLFAADRNRRAEILKKNSGPRGPTPEGESRPL